jgi:signal peptidase I
MTTVEPGEKKGQKKGELFELVKTIGYALLIALALRTILFQPFTIPSDSMEPGLLKGDYIIVSKFAYGWSRCSLPFNPPIFHGRIFGRQPQRGDIIVFQLPRDESQTYIKRLIGLPGDRVQIKGGAVYVNGKPIPRSLIGPGVDPDMPSTPVTEYREVKPNGQSYVTLDQGPNHDGDDTDVYTVPAGQYFFMGDNRDNSLDSRWPSIVGVGFVPAENLVGKAEIILASWKDGASLVKPWTWVLNLDPSRFFRVLH